MERRIGRQEVGSAHKKAAQSRRESLEDFKRQAEGLADQPLLSLLCNTAARAAREDHSDVSSKPREITCTNSETTRMKTLLDVVYNRIANEGLGRHEDFKPLAEAMASLKGTDAQDTLIIARTVKSLLNDNNSGPDNPWQKLVLTN